MRVLIAGGTGFLGRAIVTALTERNVDVSVLTRDAARAAGAYPLLPASFVEGNLEDPDALVDAMVGIDTAIFTVQFSGYPVEAPAIGRTFLEVDAGGTQSLAHAANRAGVSKIVYLSGVGANVWSKRVWYKAKGLAEKAVQEAGPTWSIIRPSWVYGPDDVSLNRFVNLVRKIPFFFPQLGPGSQQITPLFIDDLAVLVRDAVLGKGGDGAILEVGGPETITLDEIVRIVMRLLEQEKPILHFPLWLVRPVATVIGWLPGQLFSADALDFLTQNGVADLAETSRCFPNFRPQKFETALKGYLEVMS